MADKNDAYDQEITDKTLTPLISIKNEFENKNEIELLTATENYMKKQTYPSSSKQGVFHQLFLTGAIFLISTNIGTPIGYTAVILSQLYNSSDPLSMDMEIGSWFASLHNLATPISAFSIGHIMDSYGRKPALIITIIPFVAGWCIIATATSHLLLMIGRILVGLATGSVRPTVQVFLSECVEPKLRGLVAAIPYIALSFGILLTYSLGLFLTWRNVAWWCAILTLFSILVLSLVSETPIWLIRHNQLKKAEASMSWYRCNSSLVKLEIQELVARYEADKNEAKSTENILVTCKRKSVIKPLVILNGFNFFLIFCGTYLVAFYAVDIIAALGVNIDAMRAAVLTAVVRLIFSFIFCFLLFHVKRRPLTAGVGIGSGLSTLVMAIFSYWRRNTEKTNFDLYVSAVCILIYIGASTGIMILPGVMGELIPAKVRGRVAGYIFAFYTILLFVTAKMFPFINRHLKTHGLFLMFSLSSFGIVLVMYFIQPETKGKTLSEIEDYFNQNNWLWTNRKRHENNKYLNTKNTNK